MSEMVDSTAERAIVGALLMEPPRVERLREIVRHDDFYDPALGCVWEAACAILDRGVELDAVTLRAELVVRDRLQTCWQVLTQVIGEYEGSLHLETAEEHARIVARYAAMRRVDSLAATSRKALRGGDPQTVLSRLAEHIRREMERGSTTTGLRSTDSHCNDVLDVLLAASEGRAVVIPTGFECLDGTPADAPIVRHAGFLGGLFPGDLVVMAAQQGGGKTTCVQQIIKCAATAGHRVAWWSLEMPGHQLLLRAGALAAGIATGNVLSGRATMEQLDEITRHIGEWRALPVDISCDTTVTVDDIASAVVSRPKGRAPRLVVVDYLGLLHHTKEQRGRDMHEQVDYIVKALKRLAMRAGCAVILLAQLTRDGNKRGGRYTMHDLKGGGAIESHADVVLLIQRAEGNTPSVLEVAKARSGPTGEQEILFDRERGRIVEVFGSYAPPSYYDRRDGARGDDDFDDSRRPYGDAE